MTAWRRRAVEGSSPGSGGRLLKASSRVPEPMRAGQQRPGGQDGEDDGAHGQAERVRPHGPHRHAGRGEHEAELAALPDQRPGAQRRRRLLPVDPASTAIGTALPSVMMSRRATTAGARSEDRDRLEEDPDRDEEERG